MSESGFKFEAQKVCGNPNTERIEGPGGTEVRSRIAQELSDHLGAEAGRAPGPRNFDVFRLSWGAFTTHICVYHKDPLGAVYLSENLQEGNVEHVKVPWNEGTKPHLAATHGHLMGLSPLAARRLVFNIRIGPDPGFP